jgi:hypothetical protein
MEPGNKKKLGFCVIVLAAVFLIILYIGSLKTRVSEARASQGKDETEIEQLLTIRNKVKILLILLPTRRQQIGIKRSSL